MTIKRSGDISIPVVAAPSVDGVLASHGVGHQQQDAQGRPRLDTSQLNHSRVEKFVFGVQHLKQSHEV